MFLKLRAFLPSERSSVCSAGSSSFVVISSAARWTAEGKTSFDDWPKLTSSLACAPERLAITSLAFMFDEVPEPVWKTSIGNWLSCLPATISSAALAILRAVAGFSSPSSPLTRAAAPLIRASQWITWIGTRSPETGKLSTAFAVSPPYRRFAAIRTPSKGWSLNATTDSRCGAARPQKALTSRCVAMAQMIRRAAVDTVELVG